MLPSLLMVLLDCLIVFSSIVSYTNTDNLILVTECPVRIFAIMNDQTIQMLMNAVELINSNLDTAPDSWRDQLQAVRRITATLELTDKTPDDVHRRWQVSFVSVAQRVAFADADNGSITDLSDWCLRQWLALLTLYPNDVEILSCKSTYASLCTG